MTRRGTPAWRRALRALASRVHLWLGFASALILSLAGVSGSVLVFRDEIDDLLEPALQRVAVQGDVRTLDELVDAARAHLPHASPSFLRLPREPGESLEIWTDGESGPAVFVDPYTAVVLGSRPHSASFTGWLFELHVELLAGETGHIVLGITALGLIALLASGLVLWWPRLGKWWRALTVSARGSWRTVNFRLHSASGAWSVPLLFVLALTGASLVFHDAFRNGLNTLTASATPPPPPRSTPRPGAADAPLAHALAQADAALPGGQVTWVYLPASPEAPLAFRKRLPGEWHPNGRSYIHLDRHTGAVLGVQDATRAQLGTRLYDVLYPLHIGRFGAWSKALYALAGLLPLILSVSGTLVWWGRRRSAAKRTASERGAPVSVRAGADPARARS